MRGRRSVMSARPKLEERKQRGALTMRRMRRAPIAACTLFTMAATLACSRTGLDVGESTINDYGVAGGGIGGTSGIGGMAGLGDSGASDVGGGAGHGGRDGAAGKGGGLGGNDGTDGGRAGGGGIGPDAGADAVGGDVEDCEDPFFGNCPWYQCVTRCNHLDAAYYAMAYTLSDCGCHGACSQYCDHCGPGLLDTKCWSCEAILFTHNLCSSFAGVCGDSACNKFVNCMIRCGEPPPSAPLPAGGFCNPDDDGGAPPGELGADGGCCPAEQPDDRSSCSLGGVCFYGLTRCICYESRWDCEAFGPHER